MRTDMVFLKWRGVLLASCLVAVPWAASPAQTATGAVRGYVTAAGGAGLSDVAILARDSATGAERGTRTSGEGFYNLAGLRPGLYTVSARRLGFAPESRQVRVGIGQTITLDFRLADTSITLTAVVAVATPIVTEMRTPEVATNVSTEQIENLPQGNRNFLDFATLAPGVQQRGAGISSGGSSVDNTNLFIDGATYKSDVLPGGVAGQDPAQRRNIAGVGTVVGNPFPQNAVQEFRVITQNYKAEYQKAAGAVITAATKTGTNEISGDLFVNTQNESFIARNWNQVQNERDVPDYRRTQFGGSLGGPIIRDKSHFFLSYEGNRQKAEQRVEFLLPTGLTLPDSLLGGQGVFPLPLHSHLFFGKLTYQLGDRQDLMFTANIRNERDERIRGGYSGEGREVIDNDVNTFLLRHTWTPSVFTNEAQLSFQRFHWRQAPLNSGDPRLVFETWGVTQGGFRDYQNFVQDRLSLRNDLTWTAASHVVKGGGNIDFLKYDVHKSFNETPAFFFNPSQPGGSDYPFRAELDIGNPDLVTDNQQVGLYIQDDWSVNSRLMLNLGVRWDYETNYLNQGFETPQWARDSVRQFLQNFPYFEGDDYFNDGNRDRFMGAIQPRIGFSFDLTGDDRTVLFGGGGIFYDRVNYNVVLDEIYKVQRPRYEFRFAPPGTTPGPGEIVFDPSYYDRAALEQLIASGTAGEPEIFLIKNDQKPPHTRQASLGLRRSLGRYSASVTGTMVNGYDYFKWIWGHRDPVTGNQQWGGVPGISNILISTDAGRTRYRAMLFQLSRPLLSESRWGGDLSYTLAKSEANHYQDVDDAFALDYWPEHDFLGFNWIPGRYDERHRVVLNLVTRIPFDVLMSTITTLGSGYPYTLSTGCQGPWEFTDPNSFCSQAGYPEPAYFVPGFLATPGELGRARAERPPGQWFGPFGKWAYRNVDVRLQKDFAYLDQRLGVSLDVLNVFNFENFDYNNFEYNLRWDTNQGAGPFLPRHRRDEFGTFASRRMQLGLKYSF